MKTLVLTGAMALLAISALDSARAQGEAGAEPVESAEDYMRDTYQSPYAEKMPLISVSGNRFVDPQGHPVLFRGVSISDPAKLVRNRLWGPNVFERVKEVGAGIVRLPIHPIEWQRNPSEYIRLLDEAVEWCSEMELYIVIDWHSIGNLRMELFQDPIYDTTQRETFEFWRTIARRYGGHNTIAFYEIFNEPTVFRGQLGRMTWEQWRELNEDVIAILRGYDPETIPLVAGLDWAYDLTFLPEAPVDDPNVGYVSHPYEHKREKPWEEKWMADFAFAAEHFPVLVTEFGFDQRGIESGYPEAIIPFLEERGIGWIGWVFDHEWWPPLVKQWGDDFQLTKAGEKFKEAMEAER